MLNESGSRAVQPSLPTTGGTAKAADENIITPIPTWLRDELREFAAHEMPNATWDEVIVRCLCVGFSALDGLNLARRSADGAKPLAPTAPPEPSYPFERKHIPAFKALAAAVKDGPLVLDAVAVEGITGRMGSESLRGIGTFLAMLARKSPVAGLCVEALGRKPGRVTMDYRISKAG